MEHLKLRNLVLFEFAIKSVDLVIERSIRAFKELALDMGKPSNSLKRGPKFSSNHPWSFFDGTSLDGVCGGGKVLFLFDHHYFSMQLGASRGTNTKDELLALWGLLTVAKEKDIT